MTINVYELDRSLAWSLALQKLPVDAQDIYYTPEYYAAYEKNRDGKAVCFIFEHENNIAVYPFLINSVNSLGYNLDDEYFDIQGAYGYNGVASNSTEKEFRRLFYGAFNEYCKDSNIIAEFTRFSPHLKNSHFSTGYLEIIHDRETVKLNLDQSYESIWKGEYGSKCRNKIRKGKNTLTYKISNDLLDIRTFGYIYRETMLRLEADPYYYFSEDYFKNILGNNSLLITVMDRNSGEIQGAMILMIYKKYAHYHLSARAPNISNNSVNAYMLDIAVKTAIEAGCKIFHFGGGNTSDNRDSLLRFKKNFSTETASFYIGKKVHNHEVYTQVCKQWQKLTSIHGQNSSSKLLKYRDQ